MKIEYINNENKNIYDNFIKQNGNIFQSFEWVKANNISNYGALMLKDEHEVYISGMYTFSIDKEKNKKMLYFPKGPVIKKCNYDIFSKFISEVIKIAKKNFCECIRMDYVSIAKDDSVYKIFLLNNFKESIYTRFWDYTWNIPILNISKEEYLRNLKEKTRYNINYAIRNEVKVVIDNSDNSKSKFYKLLKITSVRDNFEIKSKQCYDNVLELFKGNANIFWAYKDDKLLSAAIEIIFGDKAYYMYGASSNYNRNLQSTYLLQYEMICYAIRRNCSIYDMGGVGIKLINGQDKFYNGLLKFKSNFGGYLNDNVKSYVLDI